MHCGSSQRLRPSRISLRWRDGVFYSPPLSIFPFGNRGSGGETFYYQRTFCFRLASFGRLISPPWAENRGAKSSTPTVSARQAPRSFPEVNYAPVSLAMTPLQSRPMEVFEVHSQPHELLRDRKQGEAELRTCHLLRSVLVPVLQPGESTDSHHQRPLAVLHHHARRFRWDFHRDAETGSHHVD